MQRVPVPPSLARMLTAHRADAFEHGCAKPEDFVFASLDGSPVPFRECGRVLGRALKQAGVPALSWHDLRHLFASVAISEGASVAYLSRVLGHSTPSVTLNVYSHLFDAVQHEEAMREKMETSLGSFLG